MSVLSEIKGRIDSVGGTKKITRAMYLISASRSQRAKTQFSKTMPYFHEIRQTMAEILVSGDTGGVLDTPYLAGSAHPLPLDEGGVPPEDSLFIVLAGDKGMAGGYNHNVVTMIKPYKNFSASAFWVAGLLGRGQITRLGYNVNQDFYYPVMNPSVYRAKAIADEIAAAWITGRFSAVYLVYTEMLSTIKQEPRITELLPLQVEDFTAAERDEAAAAGKGKHVYFEPSAAAVFDHLVPYYLKGMVFSALVDSYASEQCARMYAMDNATKSADKTIQTLTVKYNRARQADITQEITEIVSGIPD